MSFPQRIMRTIWMVFFTFLIHSLMSSFFATKQTDLPHISERITTKALSSEGGVAHCKDWDDLMTSGKVRDVQYHNNTKWAGIKIASKNRIDVQYSQQKNCITDCVIENLDSTDCFVDIIVTNQTATDPNVTIFNQSSILHPVNYNTYLHNADLPQPTNKLSDWIALHNDHWALAVKPGIDATYETVRFIQENCSGYLQGYQIRCLIHAREVVSLKIFSGPKDLQLLRDNQKIFAKMEWLIDCGWFTFLIKPLYELISFLSMYVIGSFAYSILLLLVCSRLAFPITQLKTVQDAMPVLRNMLISIIMLLALYKIVKIAVEIQVSPVLWIQDISLPDPTSVFELMIPWAGVHNMLRLSYATFLVTSLSIINMLFAVQEHQAIMIAFNLILDFFPAFFALVQIFDGVIKLAKNIKDAVRR